MLGARLLARAQACARPLLAQSKHAFARSVGTAPSSAPPKTFLEAGQIDRGFVEGTAMLGAAIAAGTFVPFETQLSALKRVIDGFRAAGLRRDAIPDDVLVKDYLRKNALAAQNVLIASPSFYFLFSWITGQSVAVCTARAITGTMRIVPFMAFFYGAFALLAPFATQYYMRTGGTSYADSASNANMALMLGGFVFVEAIVELRGCGVTFGQMTISSFILFVPALVGRLAAGVLTQQAKVGSESVPVVPADWEHSAVEWQRSAFKAAKALCIDVDFFTTAAGTGVFQHVLNAVTFVLLARGSKTTLLDVGRFLLFGVNNSLGSGAMQAVRTLMMRAGFGLAWNMASSQQWHTPVFDAAISAGRAA